ncbi:MULTISPECIES: hypothetical protein [Marichromatium]|uniref:Uncharacterized protein n=1 Tax=Marichromatium gracile TaxID=1048 RepID=A0A4R4A6E0_MARGR|nr:MULTISPECIES: hypothetical protein [Marichromatium]MBO8084892.1 hypothetical protein [Marichromatium sp.]MBK1708734.1 hypothetical protein [Marichromatium gracile]RNE91024.1 hypothetical protein EBL84_05205 [Marichromatium sp. AB31]RNE93799.1 hypothetical protein EBL85_05230 [Marichromatium sp. AB32]TCW34347.1 hypothetical protein EDC29_11162 [Marichromatium gracile]
MYDFSLALALYNLLPVAVTGLALWWLTGYVRDRDDTQLAMVRLGAVLVFAAGVVKASWKLLVVTLGMDIPWLAAALFPLLGPGFALLAVALWSTVRPPLRHPWRLVLGVLALVAAVAAARVELLGIARGWFLPLLTLASIAKLALSALLLTAALRLRRWGVGLLLAVDLAVVLILPSLAITEPKPVSLHWTEQSLTLFGAACFALGVRGLWRATRRATIRARQARLRQRARH